jgi:sodium-dependent dicarboxylate transporter 2/3/5
VTATLCAPFAFMLPVATPPNAIVFSSRCVRIPQMARAGFWLNLMGVLLITAFVYLWY